LQLYKYKVENDANTSPSVDVSSSFMQGANQVQKLQPIEGISSDKVIIGCVPLSAKGIKI
jgi:hypothetical protein